MTTYASDVNLSEQELWALEAAVEFYVHPKSQKLRKENQEFVNWFLAAESVLQRLHKTKKLREGLHMTSTYSGLWQKE